MFTQIVVAFDGSDHAETAIRTACDLAKRYDAQLHLVHVPQLYDQAFAVGYATVPLPVSVEALEESGTAMIERASAIVQEAGGAFATTAIKAGPPADGILAVAKDKKADLIVSGRRGLGQLRSVLMGSVSQTVAARADCAVLTIK